MCGIFGISWGKRKDKTVRCLPPRMLTYQNRERGKDSVGYAFIENGEKQTWGMFRALGDPHEFLTRHDSAFDPFMSSVLLGHCRAASAGTAIGTLDTVHPFQRGSILGAHNGIVTNWRFIKDKYHGNDKALDIDSKLIFERISTMTPKEALEPLSGKMALWWVDITDFDTLWLYSWDKELAVTKSGVVPFVFSSDVKHLVQLGLNPDDVIELDTKMGQLIRVNLQACTHGRVEEIKCTEYSSGESYVYHPSAKNNAERIIEMAKNNKDIFAFKSADSVWRGNSRTIISTGQIEDWTIGTETQEDYQDHLALLARAAYDGEPISQCWDGKHFILDCPDYKCPICEGTTTSTVSSEYAHIFEYAIDRMEYITLELFHSDITGDGDLDNLLNFDNKNRRSLMRHLLNVRLNRLRVSHPQETIIDIHDTP